MKRFAWFLVPVAALLFSFPVYATGTWADAGTGLKSVKVSYTTGTEVLAQPSGAWAVGTTYTAGNSITYQGVPYVALQSANTGHNPAVSGSTWWRAIGVDVYGATTLEVTICATTVASAYVSDGTGFDVYVWDPIIALWSKMTVTPYPAAVGAAGAPCSGPLQGDSPALGIPILLHGQGIRMAVVPTGAATSDLDGTHPMVIWHRIMNGAGNML